MQKTDWLSERVLFGLLIIGGYLVVLLSFLGILVHYGTKMDPIALATLSAALGALSTNMGSIVQAIWKSDKVDRLNADTAQIIAGKLPDQSNPPVG